MKKMTAGEKVACRHYRMSLQEIRDGEEDSAFSARNLAYLIDSAVRHAVLRAFSAGEEGDRASIVERYGVQPWLPRNDPNRIRPRLLPKPSQTEGAEA